MMHIVLGCWLLLFRDQLVPSLAAISSPSPPLSLDSPPVQMVITYGWADEARRAVHNTWIPGVDSLVVPETHPSLEQLVDFAWTYRDRPETPDCLQALLLLGKELEEDLLETRRLVWTRIIEAEEEPDQSTLNLLQAAIDSIIRKRDQRALGDSLVRLSQALIHHAIVPVFEIYIRFTHQTGRPANLVSFGNVNSATFVHSLYHFLHRQVRSCLVEHQFGKCVLKAPFGLNEFRLELPRCFSCFQNFFVGPREDQSEEDYRGFLEGFSDAYRGETDAVGKAQRFDVGVILDDTPLFQFLRPTRQLRGLECPSLGLVKAILEDTLVQQGRAVEKHFFPRTICPISPFQGNSRLLALPAELLQRIILAAYLDGVSCRTLHSICKGINVPLHLLLGSPSGVAEMLVSRQIFAPTRMLEWIISAWITVERQYPLEYQFLSELFVRTMARFLIDSFMGLSPYEVHLVFTGRYTYVGIFVKEPPKENSWPQHLEEYQTDDTLQQVLDWTRCLIQEELWDQLGKP